MTRPEWANPWRQKVDYQLPGWGSGDGAFSGEGDENVLKLGKGGELYILKWFILC